MTKNVEYILEQTKKHGYTPKFLFEITAGQGSELGTTIEEIGYFYQNFLKDLPIAFCFDTAHARGAGNDLSKWDDVIGKWDIECSDCKKTFGLTAEPDILYSTEELEQSHEH